MADMTSIDERYDDELRRQKARLKEMHESDKQMYKDILSGSSETYETAKNAARIDKALTDLAGGRARAALTHQQRSDMALRNELGETERQHERFAGNVAHALANLDMQHTADEAGLSAMNAARRNAEMVSQGRFDAELGLQKQQMERQQADSVFDQMMKLYTKGLVNKTQFKALTGVEVKSLPKRRRRKSDTGAQSAASQAIIDANKAAVEQAKAAEGGSFAKASLAQGGGGYTGVVRDFAGSGDGTKTSRFDAADSANERYITTLKDDEERYINNFGKANYDIALDYFTQRKAYAPLEGKGVYDAISGYDSLMTGDASTQRAMLTANKDDFVSRFGEGLYELYINHFTGLSGAGQHYSTEDREAIDGAFNEILYKAANGEDSQSAIEAYQTAFDIAEKNLYGQYPDAVSWEKVQAAFPEIAAQFDYEDSEEDNKRAAMGIQPESFTKEELIKAFIADSLDNFGVPTRNMKQKAQIQEIRPYLNQMDETSLLAVWAYIQSTPDSGRSAEKNLFLREFAQAGKELFDRLRSQNDKVVIAAAQAVGDEYDSVAAVDNWPDTWKITDLLNTWADIAGLIPEQEADRIMKIIEEYEYDAAAIDAATQQAQAYLENNRRLSTLDGDITRIQIKNGGTWDGRTGLLNEDFMAYGVAGLSQALTRDDLNDIIAEQMWNASTGQGMNEYARIVLSANGLEDIVAYIESKQEGDYFLLTDNAKARVRKDVLEKAEKRKEDADYVEGLGISMEEYQNLIPYEKFTYDPDKDAYLTDQTIKEIELADYDEYQQYQRIYETVYGYSPTEEDMRSLANRLGDYHRFNDELSLHERLVKYQTAINSSTAETALANIALLNYKPETSAEQIFDKGILGSAGAWVATPDGGINLLGSISEEKKAKLKDEWQQAFENETGMTVEEAAGYTLNMWTEKAKYWMENAIQHEISDEDRKFMEEAKRYKFSVLMSQSSEAQAAAEGYSPFRAIVETGVEDAGAGMIHYAKSLGDTAKLILTSIGEMLGLGDSQKIVRRIKYNDIQSDDLKAFNQFLLQSTEGYEPWHSDAKTIFTATAQVAFNILARNLIRTGTQKISNKIFQTVAGTTEKQRQFFNAYRGSIAKYSNTTNPELYAFSEATLSVANPQKGAAISNAMAATTAPQLMMIMSQLANTGDVDAAINSVLNLGDHISKSPFVSTPLEQLVTMDNAEYGIQTQGGEILVPELPDVDAVLADNSARTKNVLADALDALGSLGVDTTTANRAYYDYLTANPEAKAAALSFAIDAVNATVDTAIAQKQAEGGDASALSGLKIRMEGALSGGLETRSVHSVAYNTVDALIALPREALSNAEHASLMSAYRMFEANPSDANAASVVSAGKQAFDSINIAQLEQSGVLTKSQARALGDVKAEIENIDSGNGVGDNGGIKPMPKTLQEYYSYASEIGKRADLTTAEKVHTLQIVYEKLGDGNRGDLHIPAVEAFLTENGFDERGLPDYDWPDRWGMKEGTIQAIESDAHLPDIIDRDGQLAGNSVSPLKENGEAYTYDEKSLPYKPNPEAKHQAVRKGQYYIELIDAIKNNDLDALNKLLNRNGIESISQDEMDQLIVTYKDFLNEAQAKIKGVDVTYGFHGIADTWEKNGEVYLNGGTPQFTFPLSIEQLIQFGIYKKRS